MALSERVRDSLDWLRRSHASTPLSSARILHAAETLLGCFESGCTLYLLGNGGSAAIAEHLAAEFVGRCLVERPPMRAIALTANTSSITALANDYGFERAFSRQVEALVGSGDVVLALTTSGRSRNVVEALECARRKGARSIAFVGHPGTPAASVADIAIVVASLDATRVQDSHLAIGHLLCRVVDAELGFRCEAGQPVGKVVSVDGLTQLTAIWKAAGIRVVWTNGVFDLLHLGHVRTLAFARSLGDVLVVGVNSDASVRALKGPDRPLVALDERCETLSGLADVDLIVPFEELTPERIVVSLEPEVVVKGGDYIGRGAEMPAYRYVATYGGQVVLAPRVPGRSTTELIQQAAGIVAHPGHKDRRSV